MEACINALAAVTIKGYKPEVQRMYSAGKQCEDWSIIRTIEYPSGDSDFEILGDDGEWRESSRKGRDKWPTSEAAIKFILERADKPPATQPATHELPPIPYGHCEECGFSTVGCTCEENEGRGRELPPALHDLPTHPGRWRRDG